MSWRDYINVHPAADLFPLLKDTDPAAFKALADDIKANGVQTPVALLIERDRLYVLDGRNRLDAMEEAGLRIIYDAGGWRALTEDGVAPDFDCFNFIEDGPDFDAYAYVVSANIHRRQLTAETKAEVIRKLKAERPDLSIRAVAAITDTPKSTVARALAVSPVPHGTPAERVTGKDGKSYPAKQPPATRPAAAEPEPPASTPSLKANPIIAAWNHATREQQEEFLQHLAKRGWPMLAGPDDPAPSSVIVEPAQQPDMAAKDLAEVTGPAPEPAPQEAAIATAAEAQDVREVEPATGLPAAPAKAAVAPSCAAPGGCRYGGCKGLGRCLRGPGGMAPAMTVQHGRNRGMFAPVPTAEASG